MGITIRNGRNEVVAEDQELFSPTPDSLRTRGVDFQDVHGISEEMLEGKTTFRDDKEAQARILSLLEGCSMSAHNQGFEERHLNMDLPGFHEMKIPVIDTMAVARHLDDSKGASLQAFSENNGIAYEEAHRGLKDSQMSADAFFNWQDRLVAKNASLAESQ